MKEESAKIIDRVLEGILEVCDGNFESVGDKYFEVSIRDISGRGNIKDKTKQEIINKLEQIKLKL